MTSVTDNRTTELLCKLLDERGVEYETDERNAITKWSTHYGAFVFFARQREGKLLVETTVATEHSVILTPEQAIAATLGSDRHPYEQRITGDGSDWGEIMRDAYDDLIAAACESCTPEQMGQLADYIRAELGSGTCECDGTISWEWTGPTTYYSHKLSCGHVITSENKEPPNYCEECGAKVVEKCTS